MRPLAFVAMLAAFTLGACERHVPGPEAPAPPKPRPAPFMPTVIDDYVSIEI